VGARNYTPADAAIDLQKYHALKRIVSGWSMVLVVLVAALLSVRSLLGGFSLALGGLCGVLNMLIAMHGNERLAQQRSVGAFVISSFLRLGVFAIVPVGLALTGAWWTMAMYFAGFFVPLVLYLFSVRRHFERK